MPALRAPPALTPRRGVVLTHQPLGQPSRRRTGRLSSPLLAWCLRKGPSPRSHAQHLCLLCVGPNKLGLVTHWEASERESRGTFARGSWTPGGTESCCVSSSGRGSLGSITGPGSLHGPPIARACLGLPGKKRLSGLCRKTPSGESSCYTNAPGSRLFCSSVQVVAGGPAGGVLEMREKVSAAEVLMAGGEARLCFLVLFWSHLSLILISGCVVIKCCFQSP